MRVRIAGHYGPPGITTEQVPLGELLRRPRAPSEETQAKKAEFPAAVRWPHFKFLWGWKF